MTNHAVRDATHVSVQPIQDESGHQQGAGPEKPQHHAGHDQLDEEQDHSGDDPCGQHQIPYIAPFHGPRIASVIPGFWMFTYSSPPSGENTAPANSDVLNAL